MSIVIDASIAIAWASSDEESEIAERAIQQVLDQRGVVPQLWALEVGNIIAVNERRGRLTTDEAAGIAADLARLPLDIDSETASRGLFETFDLARTTGLTVHDAAYLELAVRTRLPLATLDRRLREAAVQHGIGVSS